LALYDVPLTEPGRGDEVVIPRTGTVRLCGGEVCPVESLTVTVKVTFPAEGGVPLKPPEAVFNESQAGRLVALQE
jgi:hypothetical protein